MSKLNVANRSNSKWIVEYAHKYFPKDHHKLKFVAEVETLIEAKEMAKAHFKDQKVYQYAGATRNDLNDFFPRAGEETKTCPSCGEEVLEQRAQCSECHYCFTMVCEGCGRDVTGSVFCPECSEPGKYHFQRADAT